MSNVLSIKDLEELNVKTDVMSFMNLIQDLIYDFVTNYIIEKDEVTHFNFITDLSNYVVDYVLSIEKRLNI